VLSIQQNAENRSDVHITSYSNKHCGKQRTRKNGVDALHLASFSHDIVLISTWHHCCQERCNLYKTTISAM